MRTLLFSLLYCAICLTSAAQDNEINLKSSIQEVTVFQQGAQVSRVARTNLPTGTHQLIFEDLHPNIDPNQVKISGTGDFTILSITHDYKIDTLSGWDIAKRQVELTKEREVIQAKINRENGWLEIYTREEQMLQQNQIFGTEKEGTDLEKLIKAADFTRERYMDIREGRLLIQDKVAAWNKEIQEINNELNNLGYIETKQQLRMLVRVKATKPEVAKFKLDYQTGSAGWYAAYDARVDNIEEPLQLDYNAFVYQNSGEDWDDIKLTISTGTPRQNKVKPKLTPWNLFTQVPTPIYQPQQGQGRRKTQNANSANNHLRNQSWNPNVRNVSGKIIDEYEQPIPYATVTISGSNVGTTSDAYGNYSINIPQGYGILNYSFLGYNSVQLNASNNRMDIVMGTNNISLDEAVVRTGILSDIAVYGMEESMPGNTNSGTLFNKKREEKQRINLEMDFAAVKVAYSPTQTQFTIDANYNIPSNGSHYAVRVSTHEVATDYLYQCAPKLDPLAYLTARVTDWQDLNLLPGNMNIYFEETYVGQSKLDLSFVEDTLQISLGPDRNIQVTRKRSKMENKGEFISGKKKSEREWDLMVYNNKREAINIRIEDQIPVSNNENVEVDSSLDGGSLDKETGIITWDFSIKPQKKKEIQFGYEIRYPKDLLVRLD